MRVLLITASAALLLFAIANRRRDVLELAESISSSDADAVDTVPTWYGEPELDESTADPIEPTTGALSQFEALLALVDPATYMPTLTDDDTAARNERAFLLMIRHAEGTAGANGYRTRFGGGLFSGFVDHPRIAVRFTDKAGRKLWTSAAGAYQFMAVSPIPEPPYNRTTKVDTWDRVSRKLGLVDFSPESQDRAALHLIAEAGALNDVRAGRFAAAVNKVRRIWASLPGAGHDQPERSFASIEAAYVNAGGQLA
jgi:muramidase (phage lysozyme)